MNVSARLGLTLGDVVADFFKVGLRQGREQHAHH
jgi:hypothetical protein